jgi:hypothetical protein
MMSLAIDKFKIPAMRTQSHDHIVLADLATLHGIPTSVKNVPFEGSQLQRRADLVQG